MKKSLIALAVAGVFVAPVAMADTTIYGAANASFDFVDSGSGGASTQQVSSNASSIGFKGSEDLGGGTSAVWQIDTNINLDKGGDSFATNDAFVGLSGADWGTLILGKHDTPYKIATRGLDVFADTIADRRAIIGPLDGTDTVLAHTPDVLAYISPAMSGVTLAAAYVAGAEVPMAGATKGSAYSLAALYGDGPINASLAYQSVTVGSAGTGTLEADVVSNPALGGGSVAVSADDKVTAWTIGGGYTMDALQINASYEKRTYDPNGGSSMDQSDWYLAGKYSMGGDAVKLAYTSAGKFNNVADTEATQIAVGYDHSLSKNTTVYALYTQISNKANAGYGLGMLDGVTGGVSPAMSGSDPSAWSLGVKHAF